MGSVLVVDDEIDICMLVSRHLKSLGINVETALSIKEALVKTKDKIYDLYIIDLNLKDGSGYDLIKHLKGMGISSRIIIISAYDGETKRALEHGADLFVPKPLAKKIINHALHTINFL